MKKLNIVYFVENYDKPEQVIVPVTPADEKPKKDKDAENAQ